MTLILNDGTTFDNSYAIKSFGNLLIYIQDEESTMQTVFDAMIDTEKTEKIVSADYNGTTRTYVGYTNLYVVTDEGGGLLTAGLKRPEEDESEEM